MRLVITGLALLAVVGLWVYTSSLLGTLPGEIPVHFGASGAPDRFGPASDLKLLPAVATGLTVLFVGTSLLMTFIARKVPGIVNIPRKEEFLKLGEDERARVLEPIASAMPVFAIFACGLMGYIEWGTGEVALKHREKLEPFPVFVFVGIVVVVVVGASIAVARRIEGATKKG